MVEQTLDVVYTWIDDNFPGFQEHRNRYSKTTHDFNRRRTRDNLDLLKYSLRSIERYAPWRGKIYIVTERPQAPKWLATGHPDVRLVYSDEIVPDELLPCFNSFAIESYIHAIPSLSQRYVYFDDDMILVRMVERKHLEGPDGKLHYYSVRSLPPGDSRIDETLPPLEGARVHTARALDSEFGKKRHPHQAHHPRIVDKTEMQRLIARFPEQFARTRAARFRGHDNILPHVLLMAYLVEAGRAHVHGRRETNRLMWYVGLEDYAIWNRLALAWAMLHKPAFLALNDNFGVPPNRKAEDVVRQFLLRHFPEKSSFER